jgi:hypothetical protein
MIFNNPTASIPETLPTDDFLLRPLNELSADLDYEAYMASPTIIHLHSAGRWQVQGYTLEENQRQTAAHWADHQARRSFAFILLSPDETRSLGCVYFNPLQDFLKRTGIIENPSNHTFQAHVLSNVPSGRGEQETPTPALQWGVEAMITFWVREDEQEGEIPDKVVHSVEQWLQKEWDFNGHLWRIREEETRSNLALERAGLRGRYGIEVEGIGRYGFFG